MLGIWTNLWKGDENANPEIRDLDANVQKPLQEMGATPLVLHHAGRPQMFSNRKGGSAGRGATSIGKNCAMLSEAVPQSGWQDREKWWKWAAPNGLVVGE